MKDFLYEVIIGQFGKDAVPAAGETPAVDAVPYSERVGLKNVVASDVQSAMAKVTLGEGEFFASVTKLNEVHA